MASKEFNPDSELSQICTELWNLDENRLVPEEDYRIDLQRYTHYHNMGKVDQAKDPLFAMVSPDALEKPTFKAFVALLDNYATETGVAEEVTAEEVQENKQFIDLIMETKVMRRAHKILTQKGKVPAEELGFKYALYELWFKLYRRTRGMERGEFDSSGFEHVFVGETRGANEVIGFHNWIQFYLQEKRGKVDYKGWIPPKRRGPRIANNSSQLISLQFSWKDQVKPIGSSFIGTSPEFEVALYTIIFFLGRSGANQLEIDEYDLEIVVHKMRDDKLGSSYPVALTPIEK